MGRGAREDLESALAGFTVGQYGIGEFLRRSRPYWEATARMLMRRWRCPEGVEPQDVVQELMMAAHDAIGTYDASRGTELRSYVTFCACDKAKKWIHKQRLGSRPHRDEDKKPSRNVRPFSRMALSGGIDVQARDMPYEAERACMMAEDEPATMAVIAVRESWQHARQHSPTMIAPALDAIAAANGDVDVAAASLYASSRLQCRLGCVDEARVLVRLSVEWVNTMAEIDFEPESLMS
jgi:DNA-directed RNA polymerase specialized sigma24 family protein